MDTKTVEFNPGRHYICACGRTGNAPFCDGSHKGSGFTPWVLELEAPAKGQITQAK